MSQEILNLEPKLIWKHFYSLTQIPRPSKKEGKIIDFVKKFGEDLGLETMVDAIGNVIIKKPATAGMEDRKGIILQGHLDMVPQKNSDTNHDFEKDPIDAYVDGDWVTAKGTTLGSDNGMGVAAAMAVLESDNLKHGPIEALFTIDEETGMTGVNELQPKYDMIFSCPPYADLEVYSDLPEDLSNMNYDDFKVKYKSIINKACAKLKNGGYEIFVVGEVRDKKGFYRDFISHTKQAFINAGAGLYNEAILLQPLGTAMLRAGKIFESGRKLTKVHENVLIFKKP